MINVPAAQQLRFAKKTPIKPKSPPPKKLNILVKDQNKRAHQTLWIPNFSTAFRMIILMRFFAGMYTAISDCDEVFNYWEPLHFITKGNGFQTWEYSPTFAIRSYAYLLLHFPSIKLASRFIPWDKRPSFFILRLTFAAISSVIESIFYRSVVIHVNPHLGRYLLFSLLFSSAMYTSATAFLPSTFAMWFVMLSTSLSVSPVDAGFSRIIGSTFGIAIASIVGWPFSALLGVPLAFEQLFLRGDQVVPKGTSALFTAKRARNFGLAVIIGASLLIPVILIDSHAYQKFSIVPLNIIKYNIFSAPGIGPELYGTSPPHFYLLNGLLSFNLLFPLALLSLPALFITSIVDSKRFGDLRERKVEQTNPYVSLIIRLSGMYIWLGVLSLQPHKEERFLFPAYSLILLNSSTTIYLMRGWAESLFLKLTKSPHRLSLSGYPGAVTKAILVTSSIISLLRIGAIQNYYHAPFNVYNHFQSIELPRLAVKSFPSLYSPTINPYATQSNFTMAIEKSGVGIDLAPLLQLNDGKGVRLCIGKEWHRYPSSFLVPDQVNVRFLRSEFKGILPKIWEEGKGNGLFGLKTDQVPSNMNERNLEEMDRYVELSTCDYIIDLDFPHRSSPSTPLEPRYSVDSKNWERVFTYKFLDNEESNQLTRILWIPLGQWQQYNKFGDYCLLRSKTKEFIK